jgi:hypothetical protein
VYIFYNLSLLPNLVQNAQQHKHMCTCMKKNHGVCKFHNPLPPMHETKNLEPPKK